MAAFNGSNYRALINGEEIKYERKIYFEPTDIRVRFLEVNTTQEIYNLWYSKKGEKMNFKITNTDIDIDVTLCNVIKIYECDEAVEIELRFK